MENRKTGTSSSLRACAYFDIQGSRIYSIARRCDDGSYDFLSLFSDEVYFVFGEPNETNGGSEYSSGPVSTIAALDKEGYRTIVNLDVAQIEKSFERCPITPRNQGPLNQKARNACGVRQWEHAARCPAGRRIIAREKTPRGRQGIRQQLPQLSTGIEEGHSAKRNGKDRLRDIAIENKAKYMKVAAYALLED